MKVQKHISLPKRTEHDDPEFRVSLTVGDIGDLALASGHIGMLDGKHAVAAKALLDRVLGKIFDETDQRKPVQELPRSAEVSESWKTEVPQPNSALRSALEKPGVVTAMAVHKAFHGNHSPDAGKIAKLESVNRTLLWACLSAILHFDLAGKKPIGKRDWNYKQAEKDLRKYVAIAKSKEAA